MKTLVNTTCLLLTGVGLSAAEPLTYSVSWLGNSFSGASNKWVQNFFIHTKVQPDGTVNTWSHWDEGGKKFGVYKDGDVIGNQDVKAKVEAMNLPFPMECRSPGRSPMICDRLNGLGVAILCA